MDRNTVIGLVLIFLIMIGFGYLTQPSKEEREAYQRKADSIARVQEEEYQKRIIEEQAKTLLSDSAKNQDAIAQYGLFSDAATGSNKFITLENDLMKVTLASKGGRIYSVELKKYKTYSGEPLVLFNGDENTFGLQFWSDNVAIKTNDLFFTPQTADSVITATADSVSVTMRLAAGVDAYIDYIYTIKPGSYMLGFDIKFTGLEMNIGNQLGYIDFIWDSKLLRLEKGLENERYYTTIAYQFLNDDYEEINPRSKDESKELNNKVKWINFKHQFFSSIIVANDHFVNADLKAFNIDDDQHVKQFTARLALPFQNKKSESIGLKLFFGPNHFKTLQAYSLGFEKVVPLGRNIIRWINKYVVINVFDFLNRYISNYGLIILLLTIFIKIIISPLTFKSYLSSAKMRVLKPQVDEINAKYPKQEDAMKKQQAVMALYKKVGVNPMGGCIPVLIQFPILIAMFRFFPASFELRQQSFLWADDLSAYDSILHLPFNIPWYGDHVSLFTLLMAVSLFITSKMNTDQMGDTNAQMPGMKFMMTWMMPIMLLLWFNNYSAGLSYYYLLSNVITIGQTYLFRRFVDDKAILAKLHENAKKPVTKSKWQQRLEEMAKQQEQLKKKKGR